jgi:hypothetical protein
MTIEYGDFYLTRTGKAGYRGQSRRFLSDPANRRNIANKAKAEISSLLETVQECNDAIVHLTEVIKQLEAGEVVK